MEDLISVIIPVYNVEPYLERCMNSILHQTYENLEIILVDDKSTDRSNEMCLEYLADKRVRIEHGIGEGFHEPEIPGWILQQVNMLCLLTVTIMQN